LKTLCLIALFLIINAGKPPDETYTFQNTKWGMSIEEVMENVDFIPVNMDENTLVYQARILKKNSQVVYRFVDSKLSEIQYTIQEIRPNDYDSIRDYNVIKKKLSKHYGPPSIDEHFWKDELFKDNKGDWGIAVSLGQLFFNSEWETPNAHIRSILIGKDYNITCGIQYLPKSEEKQNEVQNSSSSSKIPKDKPAG
jgi:hypothetical protein